MHCCISLTLMSFRCQETFRTHAAARLYGLYNAILDKQASASLELQIYAEHRQETTIGHLAAVGMCTYVVWGAC